MQNTRSKILEAATINEVVSDFVRLTKRGVNYIGCCPFHNEKTPSFTVSPAKGIYKCFGCGKGGNSIDFIIEHEAYNYREAVEYLGKKYNIPVEWNESEEAKQQKSEAQSLRVVAESITKFLVSSLDEKANHYLINDRGFTPATIKDWQIGYNPDVWKAVTGHVQQKGLKTDYAKKIGYISEKNNRVFDKLKGRIIFPQHDLAGNIIGFNARVLGKAENGTAKYMNANQCAIFDKSRVLFGLFQAKRAIQQADNCILVEGGTDVISLHQTGIKNVVGSNGTALTIPQLKLIQKFSSHLTIMTDGDAAGLKATHKDIGLALSLGFRVDIIPLPEKADPDSLAKSLSADELTAQYINKAVDFIEWKTSELKHDELEGAIDRAQVIKQLTEYISQVAEPIVRNEYIKSVAHKLNVDADLLNPEIKKLSEKLAKEDEVKEKSKHFLWPWFQRETPNDDMQTVDKVKDSKTLYLANERTQTMTNIMNGTINTMYAVRVPSESEAKQLASICKIIYLECDFPKLFTNLEYGENNIILIETLKLLFTKGIDIAIDSMADVNMATGEVEESYISFYDAYINAILLGVDRSDLKQLDAGIEKIASLTAHLPNNVRDIKIEWVKDQFKHCGLKLTLASFKKRINEYLKQIEQKHSKTHTIGSNNQFGLNEQQQDDLETYGLYYRNNQMFFDSVNGVKSYSNFTMTPILHTISTNDSEKVFQIVNVKNEEHLITMNTEILNNMNKFMTVVEKPGNFIFKGENKHLRMLKSYLYDKTTYAYEIKPFGWQRDGFWAMSNGVYQVNGETLYANDYGLTDVKTREGKDKTYYFKPASMQFRDDNNVFVNEKMFRIKESELKFEDWASQIIKVYGEKAILPICGLFTTIFGDFIFSQLGNLPLINLFGPKGSGKTELGKSILAVFGEKQSEINLTKVTPYAASHTMSMFSNSLILFDEYKNSIGSTWVELLKSIYNRQPRIKGAIKEGQDIIAVPIKSMVFFGGQEMPTVDVALMDRVVFYSISKSVRTIEATKNYNILKEMDEMGKTHFIKDWIQHRHVIEELYREQFFKLQEELKKEIDIEVTDRVVRNHATILATFAVLETKINIPFTMERAKKVSIASIKEQMRIMNNSSEIGFFWNTIGYLLDTPDKKIKQPFNFKIDFKEKEKVTFYKEGEKISETISWLNEKAGGRELLYLRWNGIYQLFAEAAKRAGIENMPENSTLHYLESSSAYLGKKTDVRFGSGNGSSTTTAMIFDYKLLGVDLKRGYVTDDETESENSADLPTVEKE